MYPLLHRVTFFRKKQLVSEIHYWQIINIRLAKNHAFSIFLWNWTLGKKGHSRFQLRPTSSGSSLSLALDPYLNSSGFLIPQFPNWMPWLSYSQLFIFVCASIFVCRRPNFSVFLDFLAVIKPFLICCLV